MDALEAGLGYECGQGLFTETLEERIIACIDFAFLSHHGNEDPRVITASAK